jgi:hypothetical protein
MADSQEQNHKQDGRKGPRRRSRRVVPPNGFAGLNGECPHACQDLPKPRARLQRALLHPGQDCRLRRELATPTRARRHFDDDYLRAFCARFAHQPLELTRVHGPRGFGARFQAGHPKQQGQQQR